MIFLPQPYLRENNFDQAGIYKLTCNDCQMKYIGQTSRSFKQRFKEHIPSQYNIQKSKFAQHLSDNQHNYTDIHTNMEILKNTKDSSKLNILEDFEIYNAFKDNPTLLLNEKLTEENNEIFNTVRLLKYPKSNHPV